MEVERLRGVVSKSLEFRGEIFILERVGRWLEGVMLEKCRKIKLVLEQVCWCLGAFVHAAPHSASAPLAARYWLHLGPQKAPRLSNASTLS